MARIYKRSDRVVVKIDEVTVKLAPLSLDQKTQIQHAMILGRGKGDIKEATRGIALAMKFSVKALEGVEDSDGNPYVLQFEADGGLTDECIDDLMNLELAKKLTMVSVAMVNGVPTKFTDADDKEIEGVHIVKASVKEPEVKNQ